MMETRGSEKINPYRDDLRPKTAQVRDMFDIIAPAYDIMNRMMTFGIDKLWRRRAAKMLNRYSPRTILDVATGTGDLALQLARQLKPQSITGIDLSANMIEIARDKVANLAQCDVDFDFRVANCLAMPFADASFDCITVAYGVRNFERLVDGYREMHRVLRPGGIVCVIELSTPTGRWVRPLYKFYTRAVIPAVGRIMSHDTRAYTYLPESIEAVAQASGMTRLMAEAGFTDTTFTPLTFGVCTIYMARK